MQFPGAFLNQELRPAYQSTMEDPDTHGPTNFEKQMPGGILSISANRSTAGTGILWASVPQSGDAVAELRPGLLRAFDAQNVGRLLWCATVGTFAKFLAPTVANGKVYLGTFDNRVNVYGLGAHKGAPYQTGYKLSSSPFVSGDFIFFQGTDDKLWQVHKDGTGGTNLGGFKTKSTPFVSKGFIYFQGTDDKLWKVSITNPSHDNTNLGGYKTSSSPFVSDDDYVYFRGTDDTLWRVFHDGTSGNNPGGYKTRSAPFVSNGYIYFQGTDDTLWRVYRDGTAGSSPGCGNTTKSTPFVVEDRLYFRGTDDRLLMAWANE
jgi:hypothetical protein